MEHQGYGQDFYPQQRRNYRGRGRGYNRRQYDRRDRWYEQEQEEPKYDENTYFYKYHYGEWPKFEDEEVTAETEVPELKTEKQEPVKEEHFAEMRGFDEQIDQYKDKIQEINHER